MTFQNLGATHTTPYPGTFRLYCPFSSNAVTRVCYPSGFRISANLFWVQPCTPPHMVNLSLGFSFSTRTWRASTAKPSFFPNSFLDPVHYPGLNSSVPFFYPFFPHWGCGHKSPTRVPGTHKSSADEPSSLHSTSDPFHIDLLRLLLPCTPHTIPTIPAPAPSQTSSCPCPPPLTVTRHGLPAPVHAKDQMLKLPVSTTARHSVATVVIVDPTPQIALSAAVVTEVGGFPPIIVMNVRSIHSSPLVAMEFSDSII